MSATAVARDRTKTEHVSQVRRVVWPESPVVGEPCIVELLDGYSAHGAFDEQFANHKLMFRFLGRWKNSPRWGDQFHFSLHTIHSFAGRVGVITYLAKTCSGIGERTAERLWNRFGSDTVRVLREEPLEAVTAGILEEDAARTAASELEASKHTEATKIELHELLKGRGFHGKLQQQAIERWGVKAPLIIRRDPFKLVGMAGAGFKRCDALWRALGLPLGRLKRQLYAACQEIRDERNGHTWVSAENATELVEKAVGGSVAKPVKAIRLGVKSRRLAIRKNADGSVWIALYARCEAERRIADGVKRLTA